MSLSARASRPTSTRAISVRSAAARPAAAARRDASIMVMDTLRNKTKSVSRPGVKGFAGAIGSP